MRYLDLFRARDGSKIRRLRCVSTRVDRLGVLKLVILKYLGLWRLAWHSLFPQTPLCQIILCWATIITAASDPPEGQQAHPLFHGYLL